MLGKLIDRFGVEAIMGRPVLGAGEARRILLAEQIEQAYQSRLQAENWSAWASDNAELSKLLNQAMLEAGNGK